ncbi:lytic transglycosylase [Salinicola aestuarinus]|uniref:lytic transglycosylase n=1 Tax=Salinicola aestuarinus TaxID=1949082 RepID=UPI000DA2081D|nr:lytic transglycosylase [Salinicola aestuarinus]
MRFLRDVDLVGSGRYPVRVRLAWGAHVTDEFIDRLFVMADRFGWTLDHVSWLMACMAFETGRTFDPAQRNLAGSSATGLIQFMAATARGLGTTTDALAAMTAVEQLDYVEQYFRPYHHRITTLPDMYLAILMPAYVGRPGGSVMFTDGTTAYRQNAGLDANTDGRITKDEASQRVQALLLEGQRPANSRDVWQEELAA